MTARVAIRGTAVISPAGVGADPLFQAMVDGRHFLRNPADAAASGESFVTAVVPPGVGEDWPEGPVWKDVRKYANRTAHLAVAVTSALLDEQGDVGVVGERVGVVVAAGSSGNIEMEGVLSGIAAKRAGQTRLPIPLTLYDEVPDYSYLRGIPVQVGQFVAMRGGFSGPTVGVNGESGSGGLGALAVAHAMLSSGDADACVVVGVTPRQSAACLHAMDADEPLATTVDGSGGPFDVDRTGPAVGEGAAAVLLAVDTGDAPETLTTCETAFAATRREATRVAVDLATRHGVLRPDIWWAHGSGGPRMDGTEVDAVSAGVGDVPVATSSKGTIGTAFECSALIDLALMSEAFRRGHLPPVGRLTRPDSRLDGLRPVTGSVVPIAGATRGLLTGLTHGPGATGAGAALIERREVA